MSDLPRNRTLSVTDICDCWESLSGSERRTMIHELDLRYLDFRQTVKDELDLLDEGDLDD